MKEKIWQNTILYLKNREILKERKEPQMGSQEYQRILSKLIEDINSVKRSLRPRTDRSYRKESAYLQAAINSLRYLLSKSQRIMDSNLAESTNINDTIHLFFRSLKKE